MALCSATSHVHLQDKHQWQKQIDKKWNEKQNKLTEKKQIDRKKNKLTEKKQIDRKKTNWQKKQIDRKTKWQKMNKIKINEKNDKRAKWQKNTMKKIEMIRREDNK